MTESLISTNFLSCTHPHKYSVFHILQWFFFDFLFHRWTSWQKKKLQVKHLLMFTNTKETKPGALLSDGILRPFPCPLESQTCNFKQQRSRNQKHDDDAMGSGPSSPHWLRTRGSGMGDILCVCCVLHVEQFQNEKIWPTFLFDWKLNRLLTPVCVLRTGNGFIRFLREQMTHLSSRDIKQEMMKSIQDNTCFFCTQKSVSPHFFADEVSHAQQRNGTPLKKFHSVK